MDEEGQLTGQPDEPDGSADLGEGELLSDALNVPPQEERVIRQAVSMFAGFARSTSNPLLNRFTSEHVTQLLNARENDSQRSHERRENESRRSHWTIIWFGTLVLFAAVSLIVFFGIRETYEVVTAIIGGLLGFAGGIGVGSRMRR